MAGKNQHVVPHGDEWAVRGERNDPSDPGRCRTGCTGDRINQQSEVVIHRPDGRIRDKNSYGHDPYPPKG